MRTADQTTITIRCGLQGWTATFSGSADMPNGVALPLPFGAAASRQAVVAHLGRRFHLATIITR